MAEPSVLLRIGISVILSTYACSDDSTPCVEDIGGMTILICSTCLLWSSGYYPKITFFLCISTLLPTCLIHMIIKAIRNLILSILSSWVEMNTLESYAWCLLHMNLQRLDSFHLYFLNNFLSICVLYLSRLYNSITRNSKPSNNGKFSWTIPLMFHYYQTNKKKLFMR